MAEIITRCPACSVLFHAKPAQLEAADGQVRCGSCHLIFDARSHQIEDQQKKETPLESQASIDSDDLLIHDDMDIGMLGIQDQDQPLEIAQELVGTDISLPKQPPQEQPTVDTYNKKDPSTDEQPIATETDLLTPDQLAPDQLTEAPKFLLTQSELTQPRRPKTTVWFILSALALILMAFQYIHFHADILGTKPAYRPWLTVFCSITRCHLPILKDTTKIRSSRLFIHSHPESPGALIVDAVIINEASFAQPFPTLSLSFEDLQGATIAHRQFKPSEYLRGDLLSTANMPTGQSVRLTLELIDPGPNAVNYSMFISE